MTFTGRRRCPVNRPVCPLEFFFTERNDMLRITKMKEILKMLSMFSSLLFHGQVASCHHDGPFSTSIGCVFPMDSLQKKAAVPLPGPSTNH